MNKILTSLIAISFAMPSMATIQSGSTCDTTNLGQSENNSTANVEATWTPNQYSVRFRARDTNEFSTIPCAEDRGCKVATYGESFTFRASGMAIPPVGKTDANTYVCVDESNNSTTYAKGQTITWNLESDLWCTNQWITNIINIDWNPKNGEQHTTNTCTYGETITLPSPEPTKTGYTFNGWLLSNPCADLNSQSTCNASAQCFWYGDPGTCVNTNYVINGCANAANSEPCTAIGYCDWTLKGCQTTANICTNITNENDCTSHDCDWFDTENRCGKGTLSLMD